MKSKYRFVFIIICMVLGGSSHPLIYAQGLISSATPESTEAGAFILNRGGNAVDAAVAVALTLGVTEPAMSGIGGRTMMILSFPDIPPIAIGGISLSPIYIEADITKEDLSYYKQIAVPSQLKILNYIWKKYGSGNISWAGLVAPAIHYAEQGFTVGTHRHHVFKRTRDQLINSPHHNSELLIQDEIPMVGDLIKQPALAVTLRRIAEHGAEDFYSGQLAKEIAHDIQENGGWITINDLANLPEPKEYPALSTTYRDHQVYSMIPPGGGWQVLQMLNLLELIEPSEINIADKNRLEKIIDPIHICHNDRLNNSIKDYQNDEEIRKKISKEYARTLWATKADTPSILKASPSNKIGSGETTHFSIVDKNGVAISVTSSIGAYFGSYTSTKKFGFFYNSYIKTLLTFGIDKPLRPNEKIPSSMSPSIVRKDGKNVLIIGTPGSKRIVSTIAQLIQLWIDGSASIKQLIHSPRVHAIQNKLYIEDDRLDAAWLNHMRSKGFKLTSPSYDLTNCSLNAYFGGVHAIEYKDGKWQASADPRRDGTTKTIYDY